MCYSQESDFFSCIKTQTYYIDRPIHFIIFIKTAEFVWTGYAKGNKNYTNTRRKWINFEAKHKN